MTLTFLHPNLTAGFAIGLTVFMLSTGISYVWAWIRYVINP